MFRLEMQRPTPHPETTILPRVALRGRTHTCDDGRREGAGGSLDFTDQIDEIYASRSTTRLVAGQPDDAIEIQPNLSSFREWFIAALGGLTEALGSTSP